MAVQHGRSERRGDAYFLPYVEPLSDARTTLADFFIGLLTLHTTYATISLAALSHNLSQIQGRLSGGCGIIAVVKANAYGHGAVDISRTLIRQGISRLAVASVQEGLALREAGITAEILVLVDMFDDHVEELVTRRLTPVVTDQRLLPALAKAAEAKQVSLPIHIKVDTGMSRLGFPPEDLATLLDALLSWKSLRVEGFMTHLADGDGNDPAHTERQIESFRKMLDQVRKHGLIIPAIHAANSAAIVRFPQAHFSLVRPGIMLYGYHTLPNNIPAPTLKPVLSLRTTVMQLRTIQPGDSVSYNRTFVASRKTRIAVLPIGYADGYSRRLSNKALVLIKGRCAPVVGLVCMDMTMVDVTDVGAVQVGDEVTLIGEQGAEAIWADDLAEWSGTIPYEILCAIGPRIPRVYHEG
ncbi:MAG TPA: alanine racemase [Nitrospira sp.]|nr:alanine racemase [Nitrospira sp.]